MSIQEILCLPVAERILLLEQIWDSLEKDRLEITSVQKEELEHRKELDEKGEMSWHEWSEVKSYLRSQRK